jgi:ankyrin repeat protein
LKEVVMSTLSGDSPRNLSQQRKLAKDLLKAARTGNAEAIERLRKIRSGLSAFKLADSQLAVARDGGFESWPKLKKSLEQVEVQQFKDAINSGDAPGLKRLLAGSSHLRKNVNAPIFGFGRRPLNAAAQHLAVFDVLLEFGANISLRSEWAAGPYGVLDECPSEMARELIQRGAKLTAHAAARLGWIDELRDILNANPEAVDEKGGDGQRPLHYAMTPQIADLLLDRGADIDARCVDHHSTAAQYALKDRPEVTVRLLQRGATPDIFMPARLGDLALANRLIDEDPLCLAARTNVKGYDRVPIFGTYNWVLGFYVSPHEVALRFGHQEVFQLMMQRSTSKIRFLDAAMRCDEQAARQARADEPDLPAALTPDDHSLIAYAALHNRIESFNLMLDFGFDPMARGMDGGTVLHMAAWVGNTAMIEKLLALKVDLETLDLVHGSTPLAWAAYGSVHRRCDRGDYARSVELLVRAGANVGAVGNKNGVPMIGMAEGNPEIQQVLRQFGAS